MRLINQIDANDVYSTAHEGNGAKNRPDHTDGQADISHLTSPGSTAELSDHECIAPPGNPKFQSLASVRNRR